MAGSAWKPDEEARFLEELAQGLEIIEITKRHGRTIGAIESRQRHMAAAFYQYGNLSVEEISKKLAIPDKVVRLALVKRGLMGKQTRDMGTQTEEQVRKAGTKFEEIRQMWEHGRPWCVTTETAEIGSLVIRGPDGTKRGRITKIFDDCEIVKVLWSGGTSDVVARIGFDGIFELYFAPTEARTRICGS